MPKATKPAPLYQSLTWLTAVLILVTFDRRVVASQLGRKRRQLVELDANTRRKYWLSPSAQLTNNAFSPAPEAATPTAKPKPKKRRSFLSRLLRPVAKKGSLPINLVPKYPVGKAKDPPAKADPLLRLQRSFVYQGQRVSPGFYLLSIEPKGDDQAYIVLSQQNKPIASIPAMVFGTGRPFSPHPSHTYAQPDGKVPKATPDSYFTPDSGQIDRMNDKAKAIKPTQQRAVKPKRQPPVIRMNLSEDQNFITFIVTDLDNQYQSLPLPLLVE